MVTLTDKWFAKTCDMKVSNAAYSGDGPYTITFDWERNIRNADWRLRFTERTYKMTASWQVGGANRYKAQLTGG